MPALTSPNIAALNLSSVAPAAEDRYAYATVQILRRALRNLWNGDLDKATHSIDLMPDEKPKASAGAMFFAVKGMARYTPDEWGATVAVSVQIAVSLRTANIPWDRLGQYAQVRSEGSSSNPRAVISWLSQAAAMAVLCNTHAIVDLSNQDHPNFPPLLDQLRRVEIEAPRIVGADHYLSTDDLDNDINSVGLLQIVKLSGGLYRFSQVPTPA
jgi:hypothetical protein